MATSALMQLTGIFVLGIGSQWLAWRIRIPAILLLLLTGVTAGPLVGFIQPRELFGDLLRPVVNLAVAIILFEGGMCLRFRELRGFGRVFVRLATLGVLVTWGLSAAAAHYLLDLRWPFALLLGAILTVTGPTVILPLLRQLRLGGPVGALLKWEGILVDPLGVTLAVLVFAAVRAEELEAAAWMVVGMFSGTLIVGCFLGVVAAAVLLVGMRRFWIPDQLQSVVALMLVFAASTFANLAFPEAGLLAVTVMGLVLANQRWVAIQHVMEFMESLTTLLLAFLFIVLAARLDLDSLLSLGFGSLAFLAALILLVRPAAILAATIGTHLPWRKRYFLMAMAPRGIVAVVITSVFALELKEGGFTGSEEMVSAILVVSFGTVLVYGLLGGPLARLLGLAHPNPQGILLVGAHDWARTIALSLKREGCPILMVDTDWDNVSAARLMGLPCYYGSVLAEHTVEELDFGDLGRLLAITGNNEVNSLACLRYREFFGRRNVFQLPAAKAHRKQTKEIPLEHRGRLLFSPEATFDHLGEIFGPNPEIKRTPLTKEFDFAAFETTWRGQALPLFLVRPNREVVVIPAEGLQSAEAGSVLLSVVPPLAVPLGASQAGVDSQASIAIGTA